MSVQVPITRKELNRIGRMLRTQEQIICLDEPSYVKTLLVARERLMTGKEVKAEIIKNYKLVDSADGRKMAIYY